MEVTGVIGYPLSPQQELAWQTLSGTAAQSASVVVRISGDVDAARLQRALIDVVQRHEILRTGFIVQSGRRLPLQVIRPEAAVAFEVRDQRGVDEQQQMRAVEDVRHAMAAAAGSAAEGMRAALVTLRDQKHLLVLVVPTLSADTESLQILVGEVAQAYAGASAADDPVQYADFSEWQRQELESSEAEAAAGRAYWTQVKDGASADLPFLGDGARSAEAAFSPAVVDGAIDTSAADAVETFARGAGVPPEIVYLAAWQVILSRVTGVERVGVTCVAPARVSSDVANACGLYAKALPLVVEIEEGDTFREFLRRSASAAAGAAAAQTYWSCSDGVPSAHFEFFTRRTVAVGDLLWSVERVESYLSNFTAKLTCVASGQGLALSLHYDQRRLSASAAGRLMALYAAALRSLAATDGSLATISLGDGDARMRGSGVQPAWTTVPARLAEQVAAAPSAPAVAGDDAAWSYAELDRQAARIAQWLVQAGVERGALVALGGERSAALLAGVIGIWKAGAGYVPIALDQPEARIAAQLAETAARALVLTGARRADSLAAFDGPVLCLGDSNALRPETVIALPPIDPSDTAYVLYTSGSTGRPKGVRVAHRHLAAYSQGIVEALTAAGVARDGLRFATVSALTADLGNTCIFPALVMGGCVHMVPASAVLNAPALGEYMQRQAVDVLKITPSHLAALLSDTPTVLPRTLLICGGEALSWDLVREVRAKGTCGIWNHYGPTETTVGALVYPVPGDEHAWPATRTVPVGTPIGRATVTVVDDAGQIAPRGVTGELWIGGDSVAAEYVGQPALTADRFVSPAWSAAERQYRTGDRVRMSLDGIVEFLGRTDDQVKIRGYRVEPGEVAHVLQTIPGVREAAVVAAGEPGDLRLVAYVAAGAATEAQLRDAVDVKLPQYMRPALVLIPALPRLANGKIDRRALASTALPGAQPDAGAVAPRTPVEAALVELWQKLLNRAPIGIHDNFFDIGGHSLLATRLVAQVRREFDVQLALRSIFEHPTVASLAEALDERLREAAASLPDVSDIPEAELETLLAQLDTDRTENE